MACIAYNSGNVFLINSNSSLSSGVLQYFTLSTSSISAERPADASHRLKARGIVAPDPLPLVDNFVPIGKCGYYRSHLYMIGTTTQSGRTVPAVADIDMSNLSNGTHSVTPLNPNYQNVTSVAKVSRPTATDVLAFADTKGIRTFGTASRQDIPLISEGQAVNSIVSYDSDRHLLVLFDDHTGSDYDMTSENVTETEAKLNAMSSPQRLPAGTIIPYRNSNDLYEALLVPEGNQQTLIYIKKTPANITYETRTVPNDVFTPGSEYFLTVDTSDASNPPIYVVTMQQAVDGTDLVLRPYTLDNFVASVPPVNNGTTPETAGNNPGSSNNVGAIAGGVVGGVLGLALIIGLLIFCLRKRRKSRQPEFESIGEKSQSSTAAWNFGASSIKQIQETQNLSNVRNLNVSQAELEALEPASPLAAGAVVLGGAYQLARDPPVFAEEAHNRVPKYATRGIVHQSTGQNYTLHYFTQAAQSAFLRSVNTTCAIDSPHIIQHRDAIALSQSTQPGGYRYLWITAPCIPNQSLHNALAGNDKNVDLSDYPFKAWSTYAMLEAVKDIHAGNFVHLGLTPSSFFYADPDESISDWQVTGFDQAHPAGERITEARLNQWSAPELFSTASSDNRRCFRQTVQTASDIWSLGCIIYTLATGRNLTIDLNHTAELSRRDRDQLYIRVTSACNEAGTVNESYRTLLEGMLQPDPSRRDTAENLAAYWKEANGLYDDDEEENNEAEESVVSP